MAHPICRFGIALEPRLGSDRPALLATHATAGPRHVTSTSPFYSREEARVVGVLGVNSDRCNLARVAIDRRLTAAGAPLG